MPEPCPRRLRALAAAAVMAVCILASSAAQAAQAPDDSTFAEKRPSRTTWERVVDFPSDVVDVVLAVPFGAAKKSVAFVYDHHVIERVTDLLTADDGSWAVVPVVKASGGGGLKYVHRGLVTQPSKLSVHAAASRYRKQDYGVSMERMALFGGALSSGVGVSYEFKSDEEFFGLGPATDPDNESNYTLERAAADVRVGHRWGERATAYVGASTGFEQNNVLAGRDSDTRNMLGLPVAATLAGVGDRVRVARVGLNASLDTRDFEGSPTSGSLATMGADWYTDVEGAAYGFFKLRADASTNVEIAYRRVFELRVAGEFTPRDGDRAIPFYYLSTLGYFETIRGFSKGRFRDANAVLASLEYRWPVRHGADATLFVDAGNVYDNPDHFRGSDIAVGWGGGFRVYNRRGLVATLEAGKSREEWRLYFELN